MDYPIGEKIGKLQVCGWNYLKQTFIAECNCGQYATITLDEIEQKTKTSCGCFLDGKYVDSKFGAWTVIGNGEYRGNNKYLACRCQCGEERLVALSSLKQGKSKSCGKCTPEQESSNLDTGKRGRKKEIPVDFSELMQKGKAFMAMELAISLQKNDPDFRRFMLETFSKVIEPD